MDNTLIELYTDGSCKPNPGIGAIGYIIRYWELKEGQDLPEVINIEKCQGYRYTTNNRMEILASLVGLTEIADGIENNVFKNVSKIDLYSDSRYFCDAVTQRWIDKWERNNWMTAGFQNKPPALVKNRDLWEMVIVVLNRLQMLNVICNTNHIPGHKGHEWNEKCDQLAQNAARGTGHISDEVYERMARR